MDKTIGSASIVRTVKNGVSPAPKGVVCAMNVQPIMEEIWDALACDQNFYVNRCRAVRAVAHGSAQMLQLAVEELEKLIGVAPDVNSEAVHAAVAVSLAFNQVVRWAKDMAKYREIQGQSAELTEVWEALRCYAADDLESCLARLQVIADRSDCSPESVIVLGDMLAVSGRLDEASRTWRRVIDRCSGEDRRKLLDLVQATENVGCIGNTVSLADVSVPD